MFYIYLWDVDIESENSNNKIILRIETKHLLYLQT